MDIPNKVFRSILFQINIIITQDIDYSYHKIRGQIPHNLPTREQLHCQSGDCPFRPQYDLSHEHVSGRYYALHCL